MFHEIFDFVQKVTDVHQRFKNLFNNKVYKFKMFENMFKYFAKLKKK